ncbi:hypothetical protein [Erythrobacter sp. KY5]|uniref:hypothetical protein n=1 Tax=Erythrobacter sp. KY5 TaxID=2011159 RepID=UPI0013A6B05E|nr:hypothetical protein [Erythrobacter sp. KY5]
MDPLFQRSPVQSRLLQFLVDATAKGGAGPTQYEVAVDGLGKDEDFDLAQDSYPRVQISRLRSNLDAYYSRNAPLDGRRITLELGNYLLKLTETPKVPILDEAHKETAEPALVVDHEEGLPVAIPDAIEVLARPDTKPLVITQPQRRSYKGLIFAAFGLAAAAFLMMAYQTWQNLAPATEPDSGVPSVLLAIDQSELDTLPDGLRAIAEEARADADIQLSYSMVSRRHFDGASEPAEYRLELHFDARDETSGEAALFLYARDDELLFTDRIPLLAEDSDGFNSDLSAALVYATSPTGAIAQHVASGIGDEPQSGYECFIKIEVLRGNSGNLSGLVDQCLERFPQDRFSSFTYARRAHSHFQQRRMAKEPILRSGQGWADVSRALELDPFNAFANFTAAKVQLAADNCSAAAGHIERAFEGAATYPAMIAALEAEANSCKITRDDDYLTEKQLQSMVARNPAPDPLLHIYLMLAALSSGDEQSTLKLANRPQVSTQGGVEHETVQLLSSAVKDPDFARSNEGKLREAIGLFLWSDAGVDRIMSNLIERSTAA